MADYLKIARAALAVNIAPRAMETNTEGVPSDNSPEIEARPDPADLESATALLNRNGVRIMALEGGATIGVWSDLDGPAVRGALSTLAMDRLPVRYLDGAGVPARYKVRRVSRDAMTGLASIERHPTKGEL